MIPLLIECCRSHPNTTLLETTAQQIKEWKIFIYTASRHGVLPLVHHTLKTITFVPQKIKERLKSLNLEISLNNMAMSAELIRIMTLLESHQIPALAFKGPALAQSAYGDITKREFGDLDILIQKQDIQKMLLILEADGFLPEITLDTKTISQRLNVLGFEKISSKIRLEVHWELLSKNYAITWDEKSLWEKREYVTLNRTPIPFLAFEHHLLYLCVHGSKHLFERLEWICDIDRSIRAHEEINWESIVEKAQLLGVERMLLLGLSLSAHFFNSPLGENIQEKIKQEKKLPQLISTVMDAHFSDDIHTSKSYSYFKAIWQMREKSTDKFHFAYLALFAPQFDDFNFVRLPHALEFLYPIIRPYRLITKYFNASPKES